MSINPVLVQLAVVGGGKRKKRDLMSDPNMQRKVTEIELLENFLSKETKFDTQAESMVAQYLECSGLSTDQNQASKSIGTFTRGVALFVEILFIFALHKACLPNKRGAPKLPPIPQKEKVGWGGVGGQFGGIRAIRNLRVVSC